MRDLITSNEPWLEAAAIVVVGVVVAAVVAAVINTLARRVTAQAEHGPRLATITFWTVSAIAAVIAIGRLAGPETTELGLRAATTRLLAGIPNLLVALILLVLGWLLAVVTRSVLQRVLQRFQPAAADILAPLAFWSILVLTVLTAADQVGLEVRLLEYLLLLVVGGVVFGSALAFGLGARDLVAGVVAGRHVGRVVRVGDEIEVGGHHGRVALLGHASVRLDTTSGDLVEVPNALLLAGPVRITHRAPDAP